MPTVVSAAPTMVTNMTGFFTMRRGFSFLKESPIAGRTMFQSKRERPFCFIKLATSKEFALEVEEVLNHRPKRESRKKIQRADQEHCANEQNEERAAVNGKSACTGWSNLLLNQRTSQSQDGHDHQKSADQHPQAQCGVVPGGVS